MSVVYDGGRIPDMHRKRGREHGGALTTLVALVCLLALGALVYFARHPILRFLAEEWVVDEAVVKADAIVVLGDDNYYADRATHAAELYRQHVSTIVVASGRRLRPSATMTEVMTHDLTERGVPKDRIIELAQDVDSTREEAEGVAKLAEERGWKTLAIVTSNYHTRRVRYIYSKILPPASIAIVSSAKDGDFDPERWWEKRISVKLFARELAGMAVAMWELSDKDQSGTAGGADHDKSTAVTGMDANGTFSTGNCVLSLYTALSARLSLGF
jgi:uncharacterized SAM-binding protein YcdF (DUF218 family)